MQFAKKLRKASRKIKKDIEITKGELQRILIIYITGVADLIGFVFEKTRQLLTPANPAANDEYHIV